MTRERDNRTVTIRKLSALPLIALLLFLLALPAAGNEGECPEGYDKISTGFDGLSWTADADYDIVILVGGPPNENNDDPDGRDKVFTDVEEGDVIARVAHDISHICTDGPDTTTTTEESTTTEATTTTTEATTTTEESTTTVVTVLPGVVTSPSTTSATLPFTGIDTGTLAAGAAGLILAGLALTRKAATG